MKNILLKCLLVVLVYLTTEFSLSAQLKQIDKKYDKQWAKADSLDGKGLPKSALEIIEKIYLRSKQENNAGQFVKAIIYKMKLESETEEDNDVKAIEKLNTEIKEAKFPIKPVLNSIVAELYWKYYQRNRYKFLNRSITQDFKQDDMSTWDIKKLVKETYNNYLFSLKDADELKKTQIDIYDAILVNGQMSRKFRPTLYDFLSHRAIDFFMNDETYLTVPAYKFEIDNPIYFADSKDFVNYKIVSKDSLSMKLYALMLFQKLIDFHINDANPEALIDAELKRLDFVKNNSVIELKDSLYLNALLRLKKKFDSSPFSADIIYKIAEEYHRTGGLYEPLISETNKWDMKTAYDYCEEAIKRFPETDGAKNCRYLEDIIREPFLSIINEEANLPNKVFLALISYRNANNSPQSTVHGPQKESLIYLRIIKVNYEEEQSLQDSYYGKQMIERYLKFKSVKEWSEKLPDDGDFQQHSSEIKLPELEFGYYVILVSTDKNFNVKEQVIALNRFWITNISYIQRNNDKGITEFYILNRDKGSAIENVEVQTYHRNYDYMSRKYSLEKWKTFRTDKDGYFQLPATEENKYYGNLTAEFSHGKDKYVTGNYFSPYFNYVQERKKELRTFFFTDRAIYRPGQTIYFKGIMLETDTRLKTQDTRGQAEWKIAATEKTTVSLYDVNHKESGKLELTSNEFGSVNGSFTAPSGVLTGQMQISNKSGTVYFSVEEYKRPKFEVLFDTIKGSYKLGEKVTLSGHAKAYAGNNVDQAEVKYRVVRRARFPFIYDWWWKPFMPSSVEMEIKNGLVSTDENGKFIIDFTAIADRKIDKKYLPVFDYMVYADVTDINGETRSAKKNVSVAYTSVVLNVDIGDKIDKTDKQKIKVNITNLNGDPLKLKDTAVIYMLKQADRIYRKRSWEKPDRFIMSKDEFTSSFPYDVYNDEDNISKWSRDKFVKGFSIENEEKTNNLFINADMSSWKEGVYMLELTAIDKTGEKTSKQSYFTLYSSKDKQMSTNDEDWFGMIKDNAEPGEKAKFILGSKDKDVRVLYEVESKNKIIEKRWLELDNSMQIEEIPITEDHRGNISIHLTFVKHNRSYKHDAVITVPYTNKMLDITFESFRNKLLPGENEEWKVLIKDKKGDKAAAEMLATLYDASLDAFRPNKWSFDLYQSFYSSLAWESTGAFESVNGQGISEKEALTNNPVIRQYDMLNWFGYNDYGYFGFSGGGFRGGGKGTFSQAPMMMKMEKNADEATTISSIKKGKGEDVEADKKTKEADMQNPKEPETTAEIQLRKNFNETAFFYPNLQTNEKGEIIIKFTIPEALTKWKMMGLAYTKDLQYGKIEKELITQKTLMITTNPPRFLREVDKINFAAKVSNLSDKDINGQAELQLFDAVTMKPLDNILTEGYQKSISIKKGQSVNLSWNLSIPEGSVAITYRIKANAGSYSDGEEMTLPVLTNRMLVTESMPLPIRGKQTKEYKFDKLLNSGNSATMKNFKLTLEFTSNPAWYAVQALPYLMETQYESSENLFERFYANSIASFIVNSDPKIKRVFDIWKNYKPEALLSNLEKNQDLKNVMLQETPWVMEANDETARKQRIALLFDLNKMTTELNVSLYKLQKLQSSNGGWPWFAGMPESKYFTQYILTGLGHLKQLGVRSSNDNIYKNMIAKAVYYMDDRIGEDYDNIRKMFPKDMDKNHIGSEEIQYLYARSYFDKDIKIRDNNKDAFEYFKGQAKKYWPQYNNYLEGMIALAMHRYKEDKTANDIIKSLKEKSLNSEEMGMYWKSSNEGYYWYEAPIETQALMIEVFDEVAGDIKSVEDLKVWLLKQKQTQDWKTGKATAEACYALLLRGVHILSSDKLVDVSIGNQKIEPMKSDNLKPEAGTGYFRTSWTNGDIKPDMGKVKITKTDDGVAWGGLYWQYFEQLDKITPHKTPLSINKKLFIEKNSPTGIVIEPLSEKTIIKLGDKIKVRIEIRTDRNMEYIHLKDMRASGFEPVNVLSSYKYQGGLGYYESTSDAATNFFIQYLNKGTYVFEYSLLASQAGNFSNGITSIQCLYAPEFTSNSEGIRVTITK